MELIAREMAPHKRVALVAHDNMKAPLLNWVLRRKEELKLHHLYATGTTGTLCSARRRSCPLPASSPAPWEDQQLGALIAEGKIDVMIFFWDPSIPPPTILTSRPRCASRPSGTSRSPPTRRRRTSSWTARTCSRHSASRCPTTPATSRPEPNKQRQTAKSRNRCPALFSWGEGQRWRLFCANLGLAFMICSTCSSLILPRDSPRTLWSAEGAPAGRSSGHGSGSRPPFSRAGLP